MIKYAIIEGLRKFKDPTFLQNILSLLKLSCKADATLDCQFMTRSSQVKGVTQPDKHDISNDEKKCY